MKLIIDISEEDRKDIGNIHFIREDLKFKIGKAIMNGTPLDDVKAEIADIYCGQYCEYPLTADAMREMILDILDNIGKGE